MGLLDQVIGGMLGPQSGGGNSAIADALTELLAPRQQRPSADADNRGGRSEPQPRGQTTGGLDELLEKFTRSGQGDLADSWVGTGENLPVLPKQLEQALDPDTIDNLSRRTGLSRDDLLGQLSEYLPKAVDRLTPQGRRPSPEDMGHW